MTDPIFIFFALLLCAYAGILADKNKILSKFSGIAITMILAMMLSTFEIIPSESHLYDLTWAYFVPLAIPLLLLNANFREIKRNAPDMLVVFIFGMVGTIIGSFIAFAYFSVGGETHKVVSMLTGSYIGGSVNLVSISKALGLENKSLFAGVIASDNILMVVYFSILSILSASPFFQKFLPITKDDSPLVTEANATLAPLVIESTLIAFLISASFFLIGTYLETRIGVSGTMIITITVLSLILANACPKFCHKIQSADVIAKFFMMVFFAVIGATSDIKNVLTSAPHLFCIISVILICQLIASIIGAKIFKISYDKVILACNANAGGPATAAAFASSFGWERLIVPAVLCGTLGYAVGTFIGITLAHIFMM